MKPVHMFIMTALAAVMVLVDKMAGTPAAVAWLIVTGLMVWAILTHPGPAS